MERNNFLRKSRYERQLVDLYSVYAKSKKKREQLRRHLLAVDGG
jgi:hypothetical protein